MSINFSEICSYFEEKSTEHEVEIKELVLAREEKKSIFNGISEQGEKAMITMTNFTPDEVLELFSIVEKYLQPSKCGRKPNLCPLDSFVLTLVCLKHYEKFDKLGIQFELKKRATQRTVMSVLKKIKEPLKDAFIKIISKDEQLKKKIYFKYFKEANSCGGVTFQPIRKPSGSRSGNIYFSGEHYSYGLKKETINAPNGLMMMVSKSFPGSTHDYSIFEDNQKVYMEYIMKKSIEEFNMEDNGELYDQFKTYWAMILDKEYIESSKIMRTIVPTKKKKLSTVEKNRNNKIAYDRIIVENYYGRMKTLFKIMYDVFRWELKTYDIVFIVCAALTNFHIMKNPLKKVDGELYKAYIRHWITVGKRKAEKRKKYQQEYLKKKKKRLNNYL